MPFQAVRGVAYRFLEYPEPPIANISGRWATGFVREGDTSIAIGELRQEENRLTGTFLTPYGDYRFLERSEEHTSELQSLMRISYAVFCLKKKINTITNT